MTPVQEAAARLRQCGSNPGNGAIADRNLLVAAYLELVPADDAEAIIIEWLREVGLCEWRTVLDVFFEANGCAIRWHGWELPRIKTRGQLRQLAACLGIPLSESPAPRQEPT